MKKFLFLGIGSALMFTMGGVGPASADNGPHVSTATTIATGDTVGKDINIVDAGAGRCAGCHRTHTAKAKMLLKEAQPALCYTCHGGGGANTDVQNGTSGSAGAALRGGGFEYALIGAGAASKHLGEPAASSPTRMTTTNAAVPVGASEATTSKHQIDGVTSGTMWGNGAISATANVGKADVTLECGSCHDPHGNGNYRILKPVPVDAGALLPYQIAPAVPAVDAVIGVIDDPLTLNVNEYVKAAAAKAAVPAVMSAPATGVTIPDAVVPTYTTANYWNVADRSVPTTKGGTPAAAGLDGSYSAADGYIANVSQWCSTCHSRYLAQAPAYETDSGDKVFTYRHTSNRIDKAGVSRPNCIQCHVSHGSNAAMSGYSTGVDPAGDATVSSRLLRVDQRGTCVMCHNV